MNLDFEKYTEMAASALGGASKLAVKHGQDAGIS